jgi:hypothetical protein
VYIFLSLFQFFMAFKKGKKGMAEHKIKQHGVPGQTPV